MSLPSRRPRRWIGTLALLALAPAVAVGQGNSDRPVVVVQPEATDVFRQLVHEAGFQPVSNFEAAFADPANTVVIALGNPAQIAANHPSLFTFLRSGGALLVATDYRYANPFLDLEVRSQMVRCRDADETYRKRPDCPLVRPISGIDVFVASSPRRVFQELRPKAPVVATNNPAVLRRVPTLRGPRDLTHRILQRYDLARYPDSAELSGGQKLDPQVDLFAIGGKYDNGRFLVTADHSVFINSMMHREDNSNVEFATNCLNWLRDSNNGYRTRCLFLEDGVVQTRFPLPVPEKPLPPFDELANTFLHHANDLIGELQQKDFFNNLLTERFGFRTIVRFMLVSLTVLLILFGFLRLWNARTGPDPGVALAAQATSLIPRGSAVRQRNTSQLESGNVYELARERARRQFAFLDGAEPDADGRPPRVQVEPDVPNPRRLRKQAERLWQIAYGAEPVRVRRRDWDHFMMELHQVVRAAQDGWWRFEPASGKT